MRVLVVGGGGREHALAWVLSRSATVFCGPGNPGTAELGTNLPLNPANHSQVIQAAREHSIDLTVIGPEAQLAAGLADAMRDARLNAFGPSAAAARIEASKAYAKEVMARAGIPTANYQSFDDESAAHKHIANHSEPLVVKASGLAAGKGSLVCESRAAARQAASEILDGRFGDAGREIVIEEFLDGEELSILVLTDGERVLLLPASQDYKRLKEGDKGPNTGGMGAYSPVSVADNALLERVVQQIVKPVIDELANSGTPYEGVLYAGLMISPEGAPSVVEFNCRMGDPEAQVVMPVIRSDLLEHFWRIGTHEDWRPEQDYMPASGVALTTVLAAPGYPSSPTKGAEISIPDPQPADTILFHAGTSRGDSGALKTSGGRVLCATGLGDDVNQAKHRSLTLAEAIEFEGKFFRRDIGWREVERARTA